ncbi:hypothetical protein [Phenylobacterium sp.]|uniref:hypothetical protein n=1 Tax=Phenylobacterium sp. TaxID=1871053 RepID=UPI0035B30031
MGHRTPEPALEAALVAFQEGDEARLQARLDGEYEGDLPAMLAAAWSLGAKVVANMAAGRHVCRVCGCWQLAACDDGCWWVEDDLCSSCDPAEDA